MNPTSTVSHISIKATGISIPGAQDRQKKIAGFDQEKYSNSHIVCIGAGGLISNIAPALARKGIGALTILDHDHVEVSNLNRQRFYSRDIGKNKAIALVQNLQPECIHSTKLTGYPISLETALYENVNLDCDLAVCAVDNNQARVAAARFFRDRGIPIIFTAVSADADHGYVFVQEVSGPCIGCLFPDIADAQRHPCPGTPSVSDVLQLMGAFVTYAADSVLMGRRSDWNYRSVYLWSALFDASAYIEKRTTCSARICR